jgi:hypothetical protein
MRKLRVDNPNKRVDEAAKEPPLPYDRASYRVRQGECRQQKDASHFFIMIFEA